MGFLSNLFGGSEKKPAQTEGEIQSSNLQAGASMAGVVNPKDRYGQNPTEKPVAPAAEAPEVSPSPENSTTTPNQAASTPEQSDDQKAA